jgi:phosphatidylserine synthase
VLKKLVVYLYSMEKYWHRLLFKWSLIFAICFIQYLAFIQVGEKSFVGLPLTIFNVLKIISFKVTK